MWIGAFIEFRYSTFPTGISFKFHLVFTLAPCLQVHFTVWVWCLGKSRCFGLSLPFLKLSLCDLFGLQNHHTASHYFCRSNSRRLPYGHERHYFIHLERAYTNHFKWGKIKRKNKATCYFTHQFITKKPVQSDLLTPNNRPVLLLNTSNKALGSSMNKV